MKRTIPALPGWSELFQTSKNCWSAAGCSLRKPWHCGRRGRRWVSSLTLQFPFVLFTATQSETELQLHSNENNLLTVSDQVIVEAVFNRLDSRQLQKNRLQKKKKGKIVVEILLLPLNFYWYLTLDLLRQEKKKPKKKPSGSLLTFSNGCDVCVGRQTWWRVR